MGDEIEIVGLKPTLKTVCTGVEMFRKLLDQGQAGDNVGILLRGTKREEVERGQVLAKPGSITPHTKFECEVYVLSKEEGGRHTPFFNGYRPQFYFRTTDVTGSLELPAGTEMVMPGDNIKMTVTLIAPDRDGREAALRHPRRRPHRRRRRRFQDPRVEARGSRPVAQLAERRSPKPQVGGSRPSWPATQSENGRMMAERIKIAIAALIAIGGLVAFYWLVDRQPLVIRLARAAGRLRRRDRRACGSPRRASTFLAFARESWEEAKRVVWPTRKETLQTTGVVFAFVFVMAIFLWMVDAGLLWVTQKLLGPGRLSDVDALVRRARLLRAGEEHPAGADRAHQALGHGRQVRRGAGADRGSGRDEERRRRPSASAASSPATSWSRWT